MSRKKRWILGCAGVVLALLLDRFNSRVEVK